MNTRLPPSRELSLDDLLSTPTKRTSQLKSPGSRPSHRKPGFEPLASISKDQDEDAIDWDEDESSPFVTEIQSFHADLVKKQDAEEIRRIFEEDDKMLSPVKENEDPSLICTPFIIAEDATSTPATITHTTARSRMDMALKRKAQESAQNSPIKTPAASVRSKRFHLGSSAASTPRARTPVAVALVAATPLVATVDETDVGDITEMTFQEDQTIDDTCFSAFSEVPNTDMTAFARLGQRSPAKSVMADQQTPRPVSRHTPGTSRSKYSTRSRSSSPTPRQSRHSRPTTSDGDTTNLLLDFTQQFESLSSSYIPPPRQTPRRSPSKPTQLLSHLNSLRSPAKSSTFAPTTPGRQKSILNLLDFDLPPAPTPRSIPTITIREMESLKSSFASQISNLKASLSGREAEVESLKRAVSDAEKRVGESVEKAREEKDRRECVEKEKEEWERRGREFEEILKSVRTEVIEAEKERSQIETRLADAEEKIRDAETRAEEAEARALSAATKVSIPASLSTSASSNADDNDGGPMFTTFQVQQQIDEKIHALSTELHAIYKKKHVTKVAGLKKGFEAKSKEKQSALQQQITDLQKQNDELQAKIDGTLSGTVDFTPSVSAGVSAEQVQRTREELESQAALIESQRAEIAGKNHELLTAKEEYRIILAELEKERVEKGDLVAAVDEMLSLQADASVLNLGASISAATATGVEEMRKSVGPVARPSGLARPGFGIKAPNGTSGIARGLNAGGVPGKSRMMSNIERMGGGGGRGREES